MITLQHTALFALAMANQHRVTLDSSAEKRFVCEKDFDEEVAWLLLPDAIRAYIGPRQISHFEYLPDNTDVSWIEYPSHHVLKTLTKENVGEKVRFYHATSYPKCVIGEETSMHEFAVHNWQHRHYNSILCHLVQDYCLDAVLREYIIDPQKRFIDKFVIRHNGKTIDGAELRAQVALFEKAGFVKLAGAVFSRTGFILNRKWFDEHVYANLRRVYPIDLAENTYKYMQIDSELDERISTRRFALTDAEKSAITMVKDLDRTLDELYVTSLEASIRALNGLTF